MSAFLRPVSGEASIDDGTNCYVQSDEDQLMLLSKFYFRFKIFDFETELDTIFILK